MKQLNRLQLTLGVILTTLAGLSGTFALTFSDAAMDRTYRTAFEVAAATTSRGTRPPATLATDASSPSLLKLTAAGEPAIPELFGPLTEGERITVQSVAGTYHTLVVETVHPLALPAASSSIQPLTSAKLVTLRIVGPTESSGRVHVLVEQPAPVRTFPADAPRGRFDADVALYRIPK